MTGVEERLEALEKRQRAQGEILVSLEEVAVTVHQMAEVVAELEALLPEEVDTVRPWGNPRWWSLTQGGEEHQAELGRIRGGMRELLSPMFGGLERMPPCTLDHLPAVIVLDIAVELAKLWWLPEKRSKGTVQQQADFVIRVYPALLQRLHEVVKGCSRSDCVLLKKEGAR